MNTQLQLYLLLLGMKPLSDSDLPQMWSQVVAKMRAKEKQRQHRWTVTTANKRTKGTRFAQMCAAGAQQVGENGWAVTA